jgi:hypothetical protein
MPDQQAEEVKRMREPSTSEQLMTDPTTTERQRYWAERRAWEERAEELVDQQHDEQATA